MVVAVVVVVVLSQLDVAVVGLAVVLGCRLRWLLPGFRPREKMK